MSDELKEIRDLIQVLVTNQALHAAEQATMKEDVEQIKHVLIEGNGQPPLTVRVALAEQELERVKEERADKKVPRHVALGIWVSIVLALGAVLAGFVQH